VLARRFKGFNIALITPAIADPLFGLPATHLPHKQRNITVFEKL